MLLRLLSLRMDDVVRTSSFFLFPQTSSAIQLKFPLSSAETLWIPLLRCAASSVSTSSSCSAKYHSSLFLGQMCRNFNQMLSGPVVFRIFVALAFTDVYFAGSLVRRLWSRVISAHNSRSLTSFALVHELFIALSVTLSITFLFLSSRRRISMSSGMLLRLGCTASFEVHRDVGE